MLKKITTIIFFQLFWVYQAFAGGLIIYEIGTPDVGLASAGWAARAEDAATVFTNPAGMTRFETPQFLFGAQPIYSHVKFDPSSRTTVTGSDGDASAWLPAGGSYIVVPINECFSAGTAVMGYFGSALDYGHHWVGRYYVTRTACQGFSFVPGAAYRVNECFSIGACANIMYAISRTHAQVNNVLDGLPDGRLRVIGDHWAVGAIVGALYELNECTRFGVQFVSEVRQKFKMKPKFLSIGSRLTNVLKELGVLGSKVTIFSNIPNWVMVSAYHHLTPTIAVMGNLGWQDWSRFARAEVSLNADNSTSITVTPKYKDTWHVALGFEFFLSDCSKGTFGVAYDSSMVSNKNRTLSLPVGKQWRFGTGYQYSLNECLQICAAYEFLWSGNLRLSQSRGPLAGTVAGKFRNFYTHFLDLSLISNF